MLRIFSVVAVVALFVGSATAQDAAPAGAPQLKTLKERVSYLVGMSMGERLKNDQMDVDQEILIRGLRDALSGAKAALSDEEMEATVREFSTQQQKKDAEAAMAANPELKAAAEKNSAEGAAFLAENGKKEGVVTLPSGLQYKVLTAGTGASPKINDTVQVHYSGKLLDGTVFDSSYERGQPAMFGVGQVIPGWTEALQKMKAGDTWEVYIPGDLAYGLRGSPPRIGPNALLTFKVELIAVEQALPEPKN
jgi:FKBP-type peptidyl-prolyl cis-trans isomerase FklB